jgi:SpoVK/Ycf46/Vps4 family AAA+-type ATPase
MSTDADADTTTSSARVVDTAMMTARSELTALTEYTRTSRTHGTDRFAIVLFGVWVVGFAVLSLAVAIPLALLALLLNANLSAGVTPLLVGFLGATGLTASVARNARQEPQDAGQGTSRASERDSGYAVRLLDLGAGTVLSVSDRLVEYATKVSLSRSRRDYALVMFGIWIGNVIAFTLLTAVLFFPVTFIASVGTLPAMIGLVAGSGAFLWIWWRVRGAAHQQRIGQQSSGDHTPPSAHHGNQQPTNHHHQRDQQAPQESEPRFVSHPPERNFSDVMGMTELKADLRKKIIDPFQGESVYAKYGVGSDKGVLFHGPPGTGKTYLAKAIAGELGVNFIGVDVGDIESKYLGEGVENIARVFTEARQNQPCLVFIDEIDAIAADRAGSQNEDKKKMVNQLLQKLSNLDETDDILVIAATNHPDALDSALVRTGRFDSKIEIPPPDGDARVKIFQHHLQAPIESIDVSEFKRATQGMVASDMEVLARRAALAAAHREQETGREGVVSQADVMNAIEELSDQQGTIGEHVQRPPDMDFSDVAGMTELKETLHSRIIDPLNDPEIHQQYGLGIENGILLYGPPGTGKTHIAKCLAGELDSSYIEAKAGDLVSKWIGEGAQNVQTMFEEARSNQPCLVFIDEIDALATDRNSQQSKSERQMVNQFLEELSQLSDDGEDVIVIGATNRIDDIDAAMLRTGRFSEKIEVPPPDETARIAIFQQYLTAPREDLDWKQIATATEGFVASDMKAVAERTARKAMQRARTSEQGNGNGAVTQADVADAIEEVEHERAATS